MSKFVSKIFYLYFTLISSLYGLTTSIIVPCYPGHAKYIPALIEYYNNQTVLPDEMIFSFSEAWKITDEERCAIVNAQPKFSINLIIFEEVKYAGQNRRAACDIAMGDLLLCQDADDIPHPQRVEIIKKTFENNQIDLLLHRWKPSGDNKFMEQKYQSKRIFLYQIKHWKRHQFIDYIHYGNVCIRRSVLDKVTWSDMKNGEDVTFVQDVLKHGFKVGILDAYLVSYRNELSSGM